MSNLLQDLRYALRMLRANPRFSAIAITALMLGIGANSAIFSVVKSVLLEPLRFPEPQRLVRIFETNAKEGRERAWVAPANFVDWRRQIRAFEGIAAIASRPVTLTGVGEPEQLRAIVVTADFFPILQARPFLGRVFVDEEYTAPGSQALGVIPRPKLEGTTDGGVVILGYGLWRQRFGASASVIGETISLNGRQVMIVGVMPPDFAFTEIPGVGTADCWIPQSYYEGEQPRLRQLSVLARLRPGISLTGAQTEIDLVSQRLEDMRPAANRGWGARIVPLHDTIVGDIRRELLVLFGAVGFVLLIACANTANLLLARAVGRQREIAVRTAVGASRGRLVQQLLTEGAVLGLIAATGGFVLAHWGVHVLVALAPAGLPRLDEIRIDTGVLFFTVGLALVTGVGCSLAPALRGLDVDLVSGLKESNRSSQGATRSWLGRALVVAEIALTLVLLIGAGLMVRTFVRLYTLDLGFEPKNVLSIGLNPDPKRYRTREAMIAFRQAVGEHVRTVPGVIAAGVGEVPLVASMGAQLRLERSSEGIPCAVDAPAPDYFRALGLRLIQGRLFDTADRADTLPVAVVNRTATRRLWPGENAVGKRISMERGPWLTVIGVIEDARRSSLEAEPQVGVYIPLAQSRMFFSGNLLVRTANNPNGLLPAIRDAIRSVDRDQPLTRIATMEERLASALAPRRFNLVLMGSFSALAFVLGAVGIYGVMSYTVSLRTREFGIRVALGADRGQVLALVLGQGLGLVAVGEALGLATAWSLHRVVGSMVYGVTTTDPITFGSAALVWAAVALAACYVPARRATKVDPVVTLRNE